MCDSSSNLNSQGNGVGSARRSELFDIEVFTGIRPTGQLTVANYMGAVMPLLDIVNSGVKPLVFVADLHALTDNEPAVSKKFTREVVLDYLGLGLPPEKCQIFIQSAIRQELYDLMILLMRHISLAELARVPTLKDKLANEESPESATSLLSIYPVLMAADILIQRACKVPVGEDQLSHLEVTRKLARRFNLQYGELFGEPVAMQLKAIRVKSLKGDGKMSKSNPDGAIFLTDSPESVIKKIKGAQTDFAGQMNDHLTSHFELGLALSSSRQDSDRLSEIIEEHRSGKTVMGHFKNALAEIVNSFLREFQERRASFASDPQRVDTVLRNGEEFARENATRTMDRVASLIY